MKMTTIGAKQSARRVGVSVSLFFTVGDED